MKFEKWWETKGAHYLRWNSEEEKCLSAWRAGVHFGTVCSIIGSIIGILTGGVLFQVLKYVVSK